MELTIHQLKCFLAVAEELHFGRAAARLHLSPSSVSEQISALEQAVTRSLFQRTTRKAQLTKHGHELVPRARRAVAALDDVQDWADELADNESIRVGMLVSSPNFHAIMSAAAEQLPDVRWQIQQLNLEDSYGAVSTGTVDCAFLVEIGDSQARDLQAIPLWQEACMLVISDRHPLANRTSVRLAELGQETFIVIPDRGSSDRWLPPLPPAAPSAASTVIDAGNFEEILELCRAGLGVNITGESAAITYARPGLRFIPIKDAPMATTYLYLRPGRRSSALERFLGLATQLTPT